DLAVYRAATGSWNILSSSTSFKQSLSVVLGSTDAIPVPGDYDGDGKTDPAIFRTTTGAWSILASSTNLAQPAANAVWGRSGDIPVTADYDGDGVTDLVVFRALEDTWYILKSSSGFKTSIIQVWGSSVDMPLPMTP
ncbi:MAG: VCBS repeat-containing protein, partial [Vicinamibacterales bacterium]|nr:VCBS repeat-containing protein [Vicinamibacterales bacterium]